MVCLAGVPRPDQGTQRTRRLVGIDQPRPHQPLRPAPRRQVLAIPPVRARQTRRRSGRRRRTGRHRTATDPDGDPAIRCPRGPSLSSTPSPTCSMSCTTSQTAARSSSSSTSSPTCSEQPPPNSNGPSPPSRPSWNASGMGRSKLILTGSTISQMEDLQAEKNPLHGRLRPLPLWPMPFAPPDPAARRDRRGRADDAVLHRRRYAALPRSVRRRRLVNHHRPSRRRSSRPSCSPSPATCSTASASQPSTSRSCPNWPATHRKRPPSPAHYGWRPKSSPDT